MSMCGKLYFALGVSYLLLEAAGWPGLVLMVIAGVSKCTLSKFLDMQINIPLAKARHLSKSNLRGWRNILQFFSGGKCRDNGRVLDTGRAWIH